MTDKLHCPFCGAELLGTLSTKYCPNEDCMCYSETISTSVWQALIDGKKAQDALKVAVDALNDIRREYLWGGFICKVCASVTLDKITSITKTGEQT